MMLLQELLLESMGAPLKREHCGTSIFGNVRPGFSSRAFVRKKMLHHLIVARGSERTATNISEQLRACVVLSDGHHSIHKAHLVRLGDSKKFALALSPPSRALRVVARLHSSKEMAVHISAMLPLGRGSRRG